jgi:hypothetical protein
VGWDDGSADFYVYVGHYKAGTTTSDRNRRNVEAQQVRADADAFGDGVHILLLAHLGMMLGTLLAHLALSSSITASWLSPTTFRPRRSR